MDSNLLQQVYRKYSKEIYAYIFTLCRDRSLTEDLVQETFMKAILSLPNAHENVRAWLYMVARNLYFNHVKKTARETGEPDESTKDESPATEETVISGLMKQELYRALLKLDDVKREVILMQYFSEIPQKDIAAILHLSPENVRVISYRAKKELKKLMEEQGYDVS